MTCPSCGGKLRIKKTIKCSLADFIGVTFVSLFLLGVVALVAHMLGPWGFAYAVILVLIAWYIVRRRGAKELWQPMNTSGVFAEGWLLGGVLFLLGAVFRFFFRWEIQRHQVCSQCGYRNYAEK